MPESDVVFVESFLRSQSEIVVAGRAGSELSIYPPLDTVEAADFRRGLENGLFTIDEDGYVQSKWLPRSAADPDRNKILQVFWRRGDGRMLFREGVCQLAAASALVLRYGWSVDVVQIELSGPVRWGVDLAVRTTAGGRALILGEVKRRPSDVRRLLVDLDTCAALGQHAKDRCACANHRKHDALLHERPEFLWVVCPGRRCSFRVRFLGDHLRLSEIDDIPTAGR